MRAFYSGRYLCWFCILLFPVNGYTRADGEYLDMISFHTPSSSGFRTIDIFDTGFVGAKITMSSNSPYLNLNNLRFSVNQTWLKIENHIEGRVTIKMVRQPSYNERYVTMTIENIKNGELNHRQFRLDNWLTGDGATGDSLASARERCHRHGGRLLNKREFKSIAYNWFGISHGTVKERYPASYVFNESSLLSGGFWVKEGKALHLHTAQKYDGARITTLCRYEY